MSLTQIRAFNVAESFMLYMFSATYILREDSRKKYLHYETKALPNILNITHFIGKGTCMQQYPKLNPDAYTLSPTKLKYEKNLLAVYFSPPQGISRIRSLISITTLFATFFFLYWRMLSHRP